MFIAANKVITVHYSLKDDNQNITINLNDGTVEETTTP